MNLMSSTLLTEDTGVPFHQLQAEQIQRFRDAWKAAGHAARAAGLGQPQHLPDRQRPGPGVLRPRARAARTRSATSTAARPGSARRTPASPTSWSKELAEDEAIAAADTLLLTIPNQLGVDYNAHLLDSVLRHVAPELGWR